MSAETTAIAALEERVSVLEEQWGWVTKQLYHVDQPSPAPTFEPLNSDDLNKVLKHINAQRKEEKQKPLQASDVHQAGRRPDSGLQPDRIVVLFKNGQKYTYSDE